MDYALDTAIPILSRMPRVLRTLLHDLPDSWTTPDYGPGTWSAREIVAHLIHGERTDWIPRARHILAHGASRPFEPFDRAGHAPLMVHPLAELLDLFDRERLGSLDALRSMGLGAADLAREGLHPALGRVTMRNLLATWVVHDLNHLAQVCKAMAFQYRDEVGAWEAYLSVLAPPNPR